ncbi:MAG TPA: helicase-related protein [Micropepsaceae bacterium]|nr:helicase-related protein [Micropepsaceae bacterium]
MSDRHSRYSVRGSDTGPRRARITAVLGPTNTGKTHFAIERMLAHRSGMIGLPLRLLAREVYDKIVRIKGAADVALITGEERIVPKFPRFFVCTVEAMPIDIPVAFLAVDEIQLCTDLERGHVFTDRLLHARGEEETMWLGALTMKGAIARIAPETHFITRPRFSDLAYTGAKKLSRLPRRSAIVAFSVEDVYGLADTVRSQRGGAAVVLGALSPRTRNAQVALYQSGEVDFMIATDAIGMGINMDVDHVAFAAREKFDGAVVRLLRPEEIGQIAGRAGRYMNDGTFGVTGDTEPFDSELVQQIENHRYDPVKVLQWRNSALDFASLDRLLTSLDAPAPARGLIKARPASDHWTLQSLAGDDDIRKFASAPAGVRLLWQACQLPDFRKLTPDEHARLVNQIYRHLMQDGVLPDDWLGRQIAYLDVVDGDVGTLSGRLAQIRTWTYAAHRQGWTRDPVHWQEVTRAVEDRLSDALHERLTQRFIDRRTAVLMRHLRDEETLTLGVDDSGAVSLGSEHVGKLDGFRFAPDPRAEGIHGRTLRAAALRGLEGEITARARALAKAPDSDIALSEHAQLWWSGAVVGKLAAGPHPLEPVVELLADDLLKGDLRAAVATRLENWMKDHIGRLLEPLMALKNAAEARTSAWDEGGLPGQTRGLAFQLAENLGQLPWKSDALSPDMRNAAQMLKRFGVRAGQHALFLPKMIRPASSALAIMLWAVHSRLAHVPSPPAPGLTSFALDKEDSEMTGRFLAAAFFRRIGNRAIRLDILERLEETLSDAARRMRDADETFAAVVSLLGAANQDALALMAALGWNRVMRKAGDKKTPIWQRVRKPKHPGKTRSRAKSSPRTDSPFAGLAALIPSD